MNTITLSAAKKNLESLIKQVENDAEPTLILVDDQHKAVLISEREFNSWKDTTYLLSNPINAEHLRKSSAEAENGHLTERELVEK